MKKKERKNKDRLKKKKEELEPSVKEDEQKGSIEFQFLPLKLNFRGAQADEVEFRHSESSGKKENRH